jgi:hypothetical protein
MRAGAAEGTTELLMKIRRRMAENLARLPNYTCRETIERTHAEPGSRHFTLVDRLRLEVAYVGGRELYAWPGAQRFDERSIDEIVGDGAAIGNGSFAMHARAVFTGGGVEFQFAGEERRNGRSIVRFTYRVPLERSQYAIQTGARPEVVPYHGYFEADGETFAPIELQVEGTDLPASLKLRSAGETMRYTPLKLGDAEFLLPASSLLSMVGANGGESRNRTQFEQCRQYAGESTIRFDVGEGDASGAEAAAPIEIPSGLQMETRLRDPIAYATAARGDPVYLEVNSDVKRAGRLLVPRGAVLSGRITRVMSYTIRSGVYFGIAVRLDEIAFGGRHGEFPGTVESVGVGTNYSVRQGADAGESYLAIKAIVERFDAGTRVLIRRN